MPQRRTAWRQARPAASIASATSCSSHRYMAAILASHERQFSSVSIGLRLIPNKPLHLHRQPKSAARTPSNGPFAMQDVKQRVALTSVFASGALTLAKGVVGFATGSLAILSEAGHSLLDLAATL